MKWNVEKGNPDLLVFLLAPISSWPQPPWVVVNHVSEDHLLSLHIDTKLNLDGKEGHNWAAATGDEGLPEGTSLTSRGQCVPSCLPECSSEWPRPFPESQRWPRCCDSWCPPHTDQWWAQPGRIWPPATAPQTTVGHCWHHPVSEISWLQYGGCFMTFCQSE